VSGYATGNGRYDDDYKSNARETSGGYAPYSPTRTTTHNENPYKHLAHIIPTHIISTGGSPGDPFYMSRNENVRLWLELGHAPLSRAEFLASFDRVLTTVTGAFEEVRDFFKTALAATTTPTRSPRPSRRKRKRSLTPESESEREGKSGSETDSESSFDTKE